MFDFYLLEASSFKVSDKTKMDSGGYIYIYMGKNLEEQREGSYKLDRFYKNIIYFQLKRVICIFASMFEEKY